MANDKKTTHDGDEATTLAAPPRLKVRYQQEVAPKLSEQFGLANPMARPIFDKIVVNVNMGRHLDGTKVPANVKESVLYTLTTISGQKPILIRAKKSVANFKVRAGYETAAMVTMRRERLWHFLDRFINLASPRIRDFRGLPTKSFDQAGSYSFGLTEQAVFPEIDTSNINFTHGMHINIVMRNSTPEVSRYVLEELGMPFRKAEKKG